MKFFLTAILFAVTTSSLSFAQTDKDFTLDLKTSTLIPKYVGTVKEIRGEVIVEDRVLQKGSKIYPRDVLKTNEKSFLKLELIDETLITIGPKSEFQVEKWSYRTKNDRDALFTLTQGKMRAEVRAKAKEKDQLKVKSPLVAMGIRGTQFLFNNQIIAEKEVTQVALLEGKIHIEADSLKEKWDLKPGDYVEVVKSETKSKKRKKVLSTEEMNDFKKPEAPEQLNLLPDLVSHLEDGPEVGDEHLTINAVQSSSDESITTQVPAKAENSQSLKEKIRELNETREQNLKN